MFSARPTRDSFTRKFVVPLIGLSLLVLFVGTGPHFLLMGSATAPHTHMRGRALGAGLPSEVAAQFAHAPISAASFRVPTRTHLLLSQTFQAPTPGLTMGPMAAMMAASGPSSSTPTGDAATGEEGENRPSRPSLADQPLLPTNASHLPVPDLQGRDAPRNASGGGVP